MELRAFDQFNSTFMNPRLAPVRDGSGFRLAVVPRESFPGLSSAHHASLPKQKTKPSACEVAGEADALTLATLAAAAEALGWAADAHRCRWPGSSTQLASDRSNRIQKIRSEFCANSVMMISARAPPPPDESAQVPRGGRAR